MVEQISIPEFHARLKAQGVTKREHCALKCPICEAVQSLHCFAVAGVEETRAELLIGFSCIGRVTGAGPYRKGRARGLGCDWTLGGFLRLHRLEVIDESGKPHARFEVASAGEAQALERSHSLVAPMGDGRVNG